MNLLRVSVATYNQVVFPHPKDGTTMLAMERKATVLKDGSINVRAQPFGGGVKILDAKPLEELIGEIQFDSERSKQEQDFRILIEPSQWEAVKQYCLQHLAQPDDSALESAPDRELAEEFDETMGVELKQSQYTVESTGFVLEDKPVFTENWHAHGFPTVRVYRVYKVQLIDEGICQTLLATTQRVSDDELRESALEKEGGRANSVLALPLHILRETYLAFPPEARYQKIKVAGNQLDESVLAVLGDVDVLQYQRISTTL